MKNIIFSDDYAYEISISHNSTMQTRISIEDAEKLIASGDARRFESHDNLHNFLNYISMRKNEYPPLDDLIIALAEKEEGRSEMWENLSAKRQKTRLKYPKPE